MSQQKQEKMALLLCDIRREHKSLGPVISFVKKFVGPNNVDMLVAYIESEKLKALVTKEFSDYNVPLAIVDTYEWGQNPSFVLVVTDEEKSPLESVARHHFSDKTYAVITMMLCKND